jgi:Caspase domain
MIARTARRIGWSAGLLVALTTARCSEGWSQLQARAPLSQESAGVFIGIEQFSHDLTLRNVDAAVNDAVDLAYAFVVERGAMPANRVLLLLAGEPSGEARGRLAELLAAGARRRAARQADIYTLVEEQSRLVSKNGLLVLSISTHGLALGGEHLLLAEDSLAEYGTGVIAANLLHAMQAGPGGPRLLLIDACREQFLRRRGVGSGADPRSVMHVELVQALSQAPGFAVLSAASPGEFAVSRGGNGIFTTAVLTGLRCREGEEVKTLRNLASVATAETTRLSPGHEQHPELSVGGGADDFVLFNCGPGRTSVPPSPPEVSAETLQKIQDAKRLLAVGGPDNVEQSFRRYRQAFSELPPAVLATLNQGLLARARQLADDSRADEGAQLYSQLLDPLIH